MQLNYGMFSFSIFKSLRNVYLKYYLDAFYIINQGLNLRKSTCHVGQVSLFSTCLPVSFTCYACGQALTWVLVVVCIHASITVLHDTCYITKGIIPLMQVLHSYCSTCSG